MIERLGTRGIAAIVGVVLGAVIIAVVSSGSDDTPSTPTPSPITTQPRAAPSTTVVESPQVAPINSCGLLPADAVDEALGLVDDEGRLRSEGIFAFELGETCRWDAEIDETGETVSMELGPGDQNDFAPDTLIDGSPSFAYPGVGDLAVWFPGETTGTMSAVEETVNGLLFVRFAINRSDVDDATRQRLAADVVTTAIERIRFGPPPPIEVDLCELISEDDAERLLAPHREGRAAARDEVFVLGYSQPVDLIESGDWFCQKLILTEIHVTAAMALESDFEPQAEIDGIIGAAIPGIGDQAVWFEDVPGGGSFASPHDTDIVSVRAGRAMFRIVIALPDLEPAEQRATAFYLALAALTHLPGADSEVIPEFIETVDHSNLGFVDNLLAKEADGEWTLGQGIVATLELFAGETGAAGVLRNEELADDSGTEIMRMAQAYVEVGADDATRQEIVRLLDILALPTLLLSEDLADEAQKSMLTASPGNPSSDALSTFRFTSRNLLQVDDEEDEEDELQDPDEPGTEGGEGNAPPPEVPEDEGYLPPHDGPWPTGVCGDAGGNGWKANPAYSREGVDLLKAQVVYPETGLTPGWTDLHLTWTYLAIEETLDLYGADSSPCLHVLLSVQGGSSSYVLDATATPVCGIFLNTPMQNRQEAQFKQEIARDIAHCIVPVVWPDQFAVASFTNRRWWNGSLAEFLSNMVYPDPTCSYGRCDLEWRLSGTLSAQEIAIPMMDRQDANWLFFQHLLWLQGLEGVIDLVDRIPGSSNPIDHQKAMAGITGMNDVFHRFAEALSDSSVQDSGGGTIAYNPPAERIPVSGKATIQRSPEPFGTKRLHLTINSGPFACIKSTASESVILTYRPGGPGSSGAGSAWEPFPTDETAYSGELVVVATTTEPDGTFSLEVTEVREDSECEEEKEEPKQEEQPDLPCGLCGPSDYYRFIEQLATWFAQMLR
ncbi:MAG: DUF3558 domain-containing protein [bacterium]|nr:DUF3558 domain-containing protein [bacterium]